jgi:hypothetical protein
LTPGANGKKSSIIKVIIILFGHLWEVELTYRYIFAFKFTLRSQQPDIFPLFATDVIDNGGKFAKHMYQRRSHARVDLNPMQESTLSSSQGLTNNLACEVK